MDYLGCTPQNRVHLQRACDSRFADIFTGTATVELVRRPNGGLCMKNWGTETVVATLEREVPYGIDLGTVLTPINISGTLTLYYTLDMGLCVQFYSVFWTSDMIHLPLWIHIV